MARIEYKNDTTRAIEEMEGSDGRANVSSRSDNRAYYNARDKGAHYTLPFDFQSAASGEYAVYWKNTSTSEDLVVSSIGVNSAVAARIKLWFVTGTAAAGTVLEPTNTNSNSGNDAPATAMEGGSAGTGITGLSEVSLIDFVGVVANGHEELRLHDTVRLGQNDAIAIEVDETAGGDVWGVIFGFYE